jgi:hypothetical protein
MVLIKINTQTENTLRYRMLELHSFLVANEIGPGETWWAHFVKNWQGDEANSWFDDEGRAVVEWDGKWHKDV